MKRFTYVEPMSVEEVLELLHQNGEDATIIAGGTALINFMKNDLVRPKLVIGLRRLTSLSLVKQGQVTGLGALLTINAAARSEIIAASIPLLSDACKQVATIRIRMMATLGGAIAYADPSLDIPPALLASDSSIVIRARGTRRVVPVEAFFLDFYETVLEPVELITEIIVPSQPIGCGVAYLKFLPATHDDYPTVSVATRVTLDDGVITDARIALGGVGTTALRAIAAEASLIGLPPTEAAFKQASRIVHGLIEPIADFRGSAAYKRDMAEVHVRRALRVATDRAVPNLIR